MWFVPVEIGLTPYPVLCRPYGARFVVFVFANRADALSCVVSPLRGSFFFVIVCNRADALFYDISPLQGFVCGACFC